MIRLSQYPTPVAGLALGTASIAVFWSALIHSAIFSQGIFFIGLLVAAVLLAPVLLKFIGRPSLLLQDIKHHTVGSVVPTMAMALMVISHGVAYFSVPVAVAMWVIAIVAHLSFLTGFVYFRLRNHHLDHIVPSWFVPPVGIIVACLTVPTAALLPVAHALFLFGLVSYMILLPIVLYRLSVGGAIEDARKPTLAILAAPASLSLAGYLSIATAPSPLLILLLFSIAVLMTLSVYLLLFHLLRLPYSPAYAAFTFPLAIGATALYKLSHWAQTNVAFHHYASAFHVAAQFEGIVASIIILYVFVRTLAYLFKA